MNRWVHDKHNLNVSWFDWPGGGVDVYQTPAAADPSSQEHKHRGWADVQAGQGPQEGALHQARGGRRVWGVSPVLRRPSYPQLLLFSLTSDTSLQVQLPGRDTSIRGTGGTGAGGHSGEDQALQNIHPHFYFYSDERDHYDLRTNKYDAGYLNNSDQAILDDFQYNAWYLFLL